MLIKSLFKCVCVLIIGVGALVIDSGESFSQRLAERYGIHTPVPKAKEKKKSESGLEFSAAELIQWEVMQSNATEKYEEIVEDIMSKHTSMKASATALRRMYTMTPYYEPFGKKIIDKMTEYAYTADLSDDSKEVNDALMEYRKLFRKHLANLDVLDYALTLSKSDLVYGDSLYIKKMCDELRENIKGVDKKGETPNDAFGIITYGEETYLLSEQNVTVKNSEIYKVKDVFYNVHEVEDEDGQYFRLYFNVTPPIYNYEKTKALREKENRFSIPVQ